MEILTRSPDSLSSSDLHKLLPDVSKQNVYSAISELCKKNPQIKKDPLQSGIGFKYRLEQIVKKPPKATKIFWTPKEQQLIADVYYAIKKKNPTISLIKAVQEAQRFVIQADRQRHIVNNTGFEWLESKVRDLDEINMLKSKVEAATSPETHESPEIKETSSTELPPAAEEQVKVETQPVIVSSETPVVTGLDSLVNEIADRCKVFVSTILTQAIIDTLKSPELHDALKHVLHAPPVIQSKPVKSHHAHHNTVMGKAITEIISDLAPKVPLKKVLIAGLKGIQVSEIQDEFTGVLDIRIWRIGESFAQLKSIAENVDHIIMMRKFVNHTTQTILKNAKRPFTIQNGGVTNLKLEMHEMFSV